MRSVTNVKISEIYCTFYSDMTPLSVLSGWQFRRFWELRQRLWMIPAKKRICMGSVTYAIPVKIKEAAVGDSILYQTDSKAYRYMITEMDKKNHILVDRFQ